MSSFDQLNAALQYHIIGTLGWTELRPTQIEAIGPILAGENVMVLAPTAGGKTEAGLFPVLSRMLDERWQGLSVLYICPLRALLNNLEPRIYKLAAMVGRRVALWHGDVAEAQRWRVLSEPPDILMTTPESLEAMLISRRVEHHALFGSLRVVIIDELHSFAADDRGWHLLALMARLERLCRRSLQRIGLSATIGNPDDLLNWVGHGRGGRVVGPVRSAIEGDVTIDHVGSLDNAIAVIAKLNAGERRLVFCDSRGRVESIAAGLRRVGVRTFVSHSSLSVDERRRAESAFAAEPDCVIVATSTLELGLDVGDLDRVVQIDSPPSVASFLQRMGRTGRRAGTRRNCLMLTTSREALLVALGIGRLWREGFIETIHPPAAPAHIFAQQVMALTLQERGIPHGEWRWWLGDTLKGVDRQVEEEVVAHMHSTGILVDDAGILGFGQRGEAQFGRRHFQDLVAAFTAPLLLAVRHGSVDLGSIDPASIESQRSSVPIILLGGRSWRVVDVDWRRRIVSVDPAAEDGRSRWFGSSRALSAEISQSVEQVLATGDSGVTLSRRACAALDDIRTEIPFIDGYSVPIVATADRQIIWTFAGGRANAMISNGLTSGGHYVLSADNFSIALRHQGVARNTDPFIELNEEKCVASAPKRALIQLKFGECLPAAIAESVVRSRLSAIAAVRQCLMRPRHVVFWNN